LKTGLGILAIVVLSVLIISSCTARVKDNAVSQGNSPLQIIAFGSCAHQNHKQPIWEAVNAESPDLFVFLGDNIYGDTEDMEVLRTKYEQLAAKPGFAELRENTQTIAIWDDHDYGVDDGGVEYPMKEQSRTVMLDFWDEPEGSPRRSQEGGIFTAYTFGPVGQRVQVILLDLRWNRSPLEEVETGKKNPERIAKNMGPYAPSQDANSVLVGEPQWSWLEDQLRQPADVRIIASSVQVLPEFSGWESWANFPHERKRLFSLLDELDTKGVFFISGDMHWSELSRIDDAIDYPLWEITSSGLTRTKKTVSPNLHRVVEPYTDLHYGLIEIDWGKRDPQITLSIRGVVGQTVAQQQIGLSELSR
jgi:alkaline phosphatase D